jgi:prophage antirepressor-like protein
MELQLLEKMPENFRFFDNKEIRTLVNTETEELWFVAKDIFNILGKTSKSGNDFNGLDDDELSVFKIHSGGQNRDFTIVSETGLYFIVSRSRKPIAKPFQKWLTREVLPSIRKNGFYITEKAKKNPSKDLIDVASQIMQTRKATVEKRHQLLSMIENFLDSQTEYKPKSLSTVISNVYQYLHIATSLKTAVLVIEDNLINSKNGLKINSYNPKQERAYDRDYLVAVNYYSEKQLAIFDRYFQSILEDVVMHLESPHTKATSKSVIDILKNSGQRQIKLVTELEIGASFQGKSRNEIDILVDNYRSGKIEYFQMVEELQTLKMGKSFKV